MERPDRKLLVIGACGAVLSAGFGAAVGGELRVPPRVEDWEAGPLSMSDPRVVAGPPAYPSWAPPPLYPEPERDPMADFLATWDEVMSVEPPRPRPASFEPPDDLPPPYEVHLIGEARPISPPPEAPRPARPAVPPRPEVAPPPDADVAKLHASDSYGSSSMSQ